jgi:hypothetical protein
MRCSRTLSVILLQRAASTPARMGCCGSAHMAPAKLPAASYEGCWCTLHGFAQWTHRDLAGNLQGMPASFVRNTTDDNGHGTHTAGIIGAVGAAVAARLPCGVTIGAGKAG